MSFHIISGDCPNIIVARVTPKGNAGKLVRSSECGTEPVYLDHRFDDPDYYFWKPGGSGSGSGETVSGSFGLWFQSGNNSMYLAIEDMFL